MFLTGCSILPELIAPAANFALGLYNADTYYSKECAWYEEIKFSNDTKEWIKKNQPSESTVRDFAKIAKNNDIYRKVCGGN
tara:strand:- start:136 stop:378 length:243 start_codon:yes stop_codon:yes gene_type:complete